MSITFPLRSFRPNKTHITLAVAFTVGSIAAFSARSYLTQQITTIESQHKMKMVQVVVAKGDLPKGTLLSTDNLAIREVPAEYAPSTVVLPNDFSKLEGEAIAHDLRSGDIVLANTVEHPRTPSFSTQLKKGRRAITVPVDEINSISGMLEPNDKIDLFLTVDQEGQKATHPLIQNVSILATGQRVQTNKGHNAHGEDNATYATITLDTTPEEAQLIITAREMGKLTALLRNPSDTQSSEANPSLIQELSQKKIAAQMPPLVETTPRISSTSSIPVLYAGQNTSKSPNTP